MHKKIFTAPKATSTSRGKKGETGVITIVNSKKNGRRIEFLPQLCELLSIDEDVQLAFDENSLVVIPMTEEPEYPVFQLKKSGNKKVIYNTALVEEIIKQLKLDYSNCVSKTLDNVKIENWDEVDIAIISGSDTKGGEEDE